MTALLRADPTPGRPTRLDQPRDAYRRELAALLDLDPAALPDQLRLVEELGMDSLAMMRILVWLEGYGVVVDGDQSGPARVADVLGLVEAAAGKGVSIRIAGDRLPTGAADPPAPVPAPPDPLMPTLAGYGMRLDPVTPEDAGFLYQLAVAPETGFRWRYRGVPPPLEQFAEAMWKQILVQFVVRRISDGQPVGQVVAYGADLRARFVYVGAVFAPPYTGGGLAAQLVALFVRYLFHTLPIAKVYLEVPGYNWPQVRSGEGKLFTVEGVLRDHHHYAGRVWHEYICAIYRDRRPEASASIHPLS